MNSPTYTISTCDPQDQNPEGEFVLTIRSTHCSRGELRRKWRELRKCGYDDDVSIYIERDVATTAAKRQEVTSEQS